MILDLAFQRAIFATADEHSSGELLFWGNISSNQGYPRLIPSTNLVLQSFAPSVNYYVRKLCESQYCIIVSRTSRQLNVGHVGRAPVARKA